MIKKVALLVSILALQGCAAAIVAGTAGAVSAATDRRTIGSQIDDNNIEIKSMLEIKAQDDLAKHANISVVSLNGVVLLLGQTPTEEMRVSAERALKNVIGITKIHNQIRIGNNTGITTRTHDSWLTSKVKTQLLTEETISANDIKVVTENGEVFLMGLVSRHEANIAVELARNVSGVVKVIKVFEYL